MHLFELVIALLFAATLLTAAARRIGAPYPALLALAGAAAALAPVPDITLDPELLLALFVAPVLLDAAYDASPRDLRDNWLPVGTLAVVCLGLTVAGVAVVARAVAPDLPWAAAIALGAIVAPPDAAAATAVLRQLRPPRRLLVILEGESLFNDASALLIYRAAVAAAAGGAVGGLDLLRELVISGGGGLLLGWLAARFYLRVAAPLCGDLPSIILAQFLGTFAVWLLAEGLHVSAILAVVAYGMALARSAPLRNDARQRMASYAVWEVVVFVLNALAFVLIGLQLRGIVLRTPTEAWPEYVGFALAVCATVILVRIAWVMSYNTVLRWKNRTFGVRLRRPMLTPSWQGGVLLSWCGMRGIVTLATALALPADFPQRDMLVFAAIAVVLATLVLQGLTLRPLLARLGLRDGGEVEREVEVARAATAAAARAALDPAAHPAAAALHAEFGHRERRAAQPHEPALEELSAAVALAQRRALDGLRRDGTIGDEAFHLVEEEIDLLELAGDPRLRRLPA